MRRQQRKQSWRPFIRTLLAGKVVLVTGGATGIGAAIVRHFARQKSTVIFFDINDEAGTGLALELSGERLAANFLHVDLTDEASARTSQHYIVDGGWV